LRYVFKQSFRDKLLGRLTFYAHVVTTQEVSGITSKVGNRHMVFWDIERCSLSRAVSVLTKVQKKYNLSNIYLSSDYPNSYHGWCFSLVPLSTMLKILIDSKSILDWGFFVWTVKRRAATLRISKKRNRPFQKVMKCIRSYYVPAPEKVTRATYTTGSEKYPQQVFEKVSRQ
jgi:hypothetical protein